jgi:gluconokinase
VPASKSSEGVLALDIGTSSVRAAVYDTRGRLLEPTLSDLRYQLVTNEQGEASSDPDRLVELIGQTIDLALKSARKAKVSILGVGTSCYWHSLMGIDQSGRPTTELLTWADTRSALQAQRLRAGSDEKAYHARSGCFFHASYWPAKLRWLQESRPTAFRKTSRWLSLGEYLVEQLLGPVSVSISMASGTGLLDINRCEWDPEALRLAGIEPRALSPLAEWDEPLRELRPHYERRWPELAGIPWYLPLGDGALANVGCGAVSPRWWCATIGTSSALRVVLEAERLAIPWGAFVYRLDRRHFVLGGALSEGGNVIRWFSDALGLGKRKKLEQAAGSIAPDSHGLTVLPFWAGERSPNWRAEARGVITGLALSTQPAHLLRASMEAITYQLVNVAFAMGRAAASPESLVATGGQLMHSALWSQMLADATDVPVMMSPQLEASSRGAALLALHALGRLPGLWSLTPGRGRSFRPRAAAHTTYERGRLRQAQLYQAIFGGDGLSGLSAAPESDSRRKDPRNPTARR